MNEFDAIVFHRYHMVQAWKTDFRDKIERFNQASLVAYMKDGTQIKLFVLSGPFDYQKLHGWEFEKISIHVDVPFAMSADVRNNARYKTVEMFQL